MKKLSFLVLAIPFIMFWGCTEKGGSDVSDPSSPTPDPGYYESTSGDEGREGGAVESGDAGEPSVVGDSGDSEPGTGNGQAEAGRVTAGEWRDLDNWLFWSNLMTNKQIDQEGSDYTIYSDYWGFYTNNRVAVSVKNGAGDAVPDAELVLVSMAGGNNQPLFTARTDNKGLANLWIGLTQLQNGVDDSSLRLVLDGTLQDQPVSVTRWGDEPKLNELTAPATSVSGIDIAFIVDATGSMGDEIDFLKADLTNIIGKVQEKHAAADIRTAALFYRDEGDEYVTRVRDFNSDLAKTTGFIASQSADGGGDYPEAVHTALEVGLQELSWSETGRIRLAFMLLDAPPHKQDDVIKSLQKSIPVYAQKGIRIIPVAASGVDKPTEFFLRFTAIATDGTYVFLTNHSGIGGDHIAATVGDYKVELLSDLVIRLIDQYLQ